jgi:His/Glu/Gln/Arg/opine family amino acid ABC transporter permease subunit
MESVWEYRMLLWQGTVVTVQLAVTALGLSVILGFAGAFAKRSQSVTARAVAEAYTTVVRGVPDLVLMMLLFYGGQQVLNRLGALTGWWDYVELDQFVAGVLAIGFVFGAYMTETFRGALLAIPEGQLDAGRAIGFSRVQLFTHISWPQMVRHALPGFSNNWLVLLKATALVSVIGLHDLVWNATTAGRSVREPFTFMLAVLLIYLLLTALSDLALRRLRRRYEFSDAWHS